MSQTIQIKKKNQGGRGGEKKLAQIRLPELPLYKVILWKPVHGHRGRGRPRATYVDNLLIDTGVETAGDTHAGQIGVEKSHPRSSKSSH